MADVKIRIIGEDQASGVLKGIDAEVGGFSSSFTELSSKISLVAGALRTMAQVAETAFEWGKQGAAITQTEESFDRLLQKSGVTTDLLGELRAASRGTVDDVTLMASAMNTAAGANDALAKQLLEVSPRLLTIAKAANKMNPTLGDTTFMFESLTAGIKRQSPLLIDNTGLKIKLGEANQELAKSLGKTVEEMTAAEQSQALLNATLKAGDQLIAQVGGNVDSTTDAYAQLDTALKQAAGEFKQTLAPAVAEVAQALTELLNGYRELTRGTQGEIDAIAEQTATYDEYKQEVTELLEAKKLFVKEVDGQIHVYKREGQGMREVTDEYNIMAQAIYNTRDAVAEYGKVVDGQRVAIEGVAGANAMMNVTAGEAATSQAALEQQLEESKEAAEEYSKAIEKLNGLSLDMGMGGGIAKAWDDYKAKVTDLREENAKLDEQIKKLVSEGIKPNSAEIQELTSRYNDNVEKQRELRDAAHEATKELIFQKVSAYMSGDAALALAQSMGLISKADYDASQAIIGLVKQFDTLNKDGFIETGEATQEFIARLTALGGAFDVADEDMQGFTDSLRDEVIAARMAANETKRLADVQEALEAGLAGRLTGAMATYRDTVRDASLANADLNRQYWDMVQSGEASEEQLRALGVQIDENNRKQIEALDAMKKTTAEMIYQQASQGLSADAALVLARGLGLVSEQDYNLIVQLQQLKAQFDANHDGMISAAEGADQYTAAVLRLYEAQVQLMNVLPSGEGVGGAGYTGNGIYVGGPGETIGPGAMPSAVTTSGSGIYTAQAGTWAVPVTYINNGVTMSDANNIQQVLTPIVNNILLGR